MKSSLHRALLGAVASVGLLGLVAGPALAQTTVTSTWSGSGLLTFSGVAPGTTSGFNTGGNVTNGTASFTNAENNPYNYGVPNVNVNIDAQVANGGVLNSIVDRTASYAPLYGAAGQSIYAGASSSDGTAALVTNTVTNYAGLEDLGHYGVAQTPDHNTVEASGSSIQLQYAVNTGTANNQAGILINGAGSASITQNYAGASANSFSMGVGGGDYQLANFTAQGIGTVSTGGVATGSLGVTASNSTIYGTSANPASITTIINYDTTGAAPGTSQTWNYGITGNAH